MMSDKIIKGTKRCEAWVCGQNIFHNHQCQKKKEAVNKLFCKTHSPEAIAARQEARAARREGRYHGERMMQIRLATKEQLHACGLPTALEWSRAKKQISRLQFLVIKGKDC